MAISPIDAYRRQIERELKQGDATEGTHRPALKTLIESLHPGVTATNEPKRVACGAPDFSVSRKNVPLGKIETKDIGVDLDEMERGKGPHGEQFTRYRDGLPNWILTDYLEFRWYVAGEKRLDARLAEFDLKGKLKPTPDGEEKLTQLLDAFIKQEALTVSTAKDLAQRMAGMTRIVRDLIIRTFEHEGVGEGSALPKERGWLHNWLAAFREVLLPDLDEKQFADMFAQTLAYGLFAAKVHSGSGKAFSREMAAFNLPKTNPFLRKLFSEIAGVDMPDTIDWAVDDIVELLKHADLGEILKDFGKGKGKEDPVVHFYETFLAAYDPKMRELRGVYYTPEPVVSYIVRSVDYLLKARFGCPAGLADTATVEYEPDAVAAVSDRRTPVAAMSPSPSSPKSAARTPPLQKTTSPRVLILDPACGTGTFLYFVIQEIYQKFAAQKGAWDGYVAAHLLNRLFGFELLIAPYAVAHLKLGMELQETGYSFGSDQRLGIYLTNTLEEAAKRSEKLFAQWISDEANAAASIKRDLPIMVVMGNPPYSGHSANKGKWARHLVDDYKFVDGQPLDEKNPKWLQDDYVKFIRFGQWRIEKTGYGILAFITNNGYVDNPTFRGMRRSLMKCFNEIFILDLHGSSRKRETAPGGNKDENVFDITQGVAIALLVKGPKGSGCSVFHADLWGLREAKYNALFEADAQSTNWRQLSPKAPHYLFIPRDEDLLAEYEAAYRVTEIFSAQSVAVVTSRDQIVMDFDKNELKRRIDHLLAPNSDVDQLRKEYPLNESAHWSLAEARLQILDRKSAPPVFASCVYKPFDLRPFAYCPALLERPREEVMRNLLKANSALLYTRTTSPNQTFSHVFAVRGIPIGRTFADLAAITYVAPLYVYPDEKGVQDSFDHARRANLNPAFIADFEKRLGLKFVPEGPDVGADQRVRPREGASRQGGTPLQFGPEDVFNYMYAVFHSPTYRKRYAEFLKIDFPRVPLTSDVNLFRALCEKGAELVALHLLESPALENPITGYPVKGSNVVEKGFPKYVAPGEPEPGTGKPLKAGRVYINAAVAAMSSSPSSPKSPVRTPAQSAAGTPPLQGQYFEGVPPEVWNFHIGGYQVCEKWLKDRRGRTLSFDDLTHYAKVVTALKETIRVMAEIDAAIPKWPID